MTEWVRPLERQLLNTQAFLGMAGREPKSPVESAAVAAETVIVEKTELALNGKREEREEERNHALPFED